MLYIGLDLHEKQSTYCALDPNGKVVQERTVHKRWIHIADYVGKEIAEPFAICFEANTGTGHLFDQFRKLAAAERVVVAHPGKLRLIFRTKRKSDRVDAKKLAMLLLLDQVPEAYVPRAETRAWRQLIRLRDRLVKKRTSTRAAIRTFLRECGVSAPRGLWSRRGMAWLASVELAQPMLRLKLDLLAEDVGELDEKVKRVTKELDRIGRDHPGVCLLRTIPGIGMRTAEALIAYIDVAKRFGTSRQVGAYFGLVPCQDESAGIARFGHITRQGPGFVRGLLTEAAWQGIRRSPTIRRFFEGIEGGKADRRKVAIVATAHYLLRVSFAMLRTGAEWCERAA